jgi:pimeloyl-ACP methyl ester carboxylesterase
VNVVCLHALGLTGADWDELAAGLAPDHHVVAPTLRGHAGAPWTDEYSFEVMCDDVIALIEPMGPVVLIGHSMGGTVSFLLTQARPDLVTHLVIEDSPPPVKGLMNVPDLPEEKPDGFEADYDWRMLRALMGQLRDPDPRWWEDLATITVPTLVIAGGDTSHVPQQVLRDAAAQIPKAELVELGGGHRVHTAKPEEYLAVVRDFLS